MATKLTLPDRAHRHLGQWYDQRLLGGLAVRRGSAFGWRFGQHAVTVNKVVHLTPRAPDQDTDPGIALLGHECYHVVQQIEAGWWRFLARYAWSWRPSHVKDGWKHPLERPAYDRQREIREALRT